MTDTKKKILDAAEGLIADQGYAATSLRQIIAKAGVNLASVHYHFGSKEELLDELVVRKAGPVNERRLAMLDRFEADAGGGPVPIEKLLEAFLAPPLEAVESRPVFVRLMGRLYAEGLMPLVVARHFRPMVERFYAAMRRSLPDLPADELAWRVHFMVAAMAHTMWGPPMPLFGEGEPVSHDAKAVVRRLVVFLSAGFQAPVSEKDPMEVAG